MDRAQAENVIKLALNIAKELSPSMTLESDESILAAVQEPLAKVATLCFRPQDGDCPWRVRVNKVKGV